MTHPVLGRAMPVHFLMTDLAAWGLQNPSDLQYQWDDEAHGPLLDDIRAVEAMCFGRAGLVRLTLHDFGWDLGQWRSLFLDSWQADPKGSEKYGGWGYNHPYAAGIVDKIVQDAMVREDRARLEARATEAWPTQLRVCLDAFQKDWNDPEEPLWLAAVDGWPFD